MRESISERLLHFIWQFQYFNKSHLTTTTGEAVQVIFSGNYNQNQGPDFLQAKISIDHTLWAGTVELHVKSSDWKKHRHDTDSNYNNVVLHVVWEDDMPVGTMPVLELRSRVPKILLQRYEDLMNAIAFIPCEQSACKVKPLIWQSWKDRLLAERLDRKAKVVETYLQENNYHWEETFWWLLARNFGMKVNADAFEAIARSVPFNLIARHRNKPLRLEALLMGRAGLLKGKFRDEYPRLLCTEYSLYDQKQKFHNAAKTLTEVSPVFFLRIRPGSFPTTRLAQLVMVIHKSAHLFAEIRELSDVYDVKKLFKVAAGEYWNTHYRFDKSTSYKPKKIGMSMIDNIIINTVIPILFTYGNYHQQDRYKEKAWKWLEQLAPENNSIINGFKRAGISSDNAGHTQSLIELKNEYCNKKRCLDCAIGNAILKNFLTPIHGGQR